MKDTEAIKRDIFEKVQQRLTEEAARSPTDKGNTTGNTERFDRVLALWVNLQKAMQFRWNDEAKEDVQTPWDCEDSRVRNAWAALTNPRNELALEILSYQLPEGAQLEMVQKALQVCRERGKTSGL